MSRNELRSLLTVLMYAGIGVFFVPFLFGKSQGAHWIEAGGAFAAVVFGLSRCFFTEEECWWRVH